ncbi:hypothetical protein HBI56_032060 [Parastagonospora nodorum]|uniref:Uncharacterized protein n=1 Tax=Phaeosphaeria nodorum (strain SN15 / ATCC MYA-4574 / FGSC 10173) TaxID=321614 RepID=A0A7U2EYV2_PHANO|nr:hypothetical protein HBH56_019770 [Parastagonospora nodorum]QRC95376.1 hypothetical protein JI435_407260 [Parastagonospora nodorum SN15]KAH3936797.1 hypothetical protein HBH54_014730 [Parastagonospora nodorum]KAH3953448.1 hypothetical protein HBH53_026870 [Parastagonospora nodorum]KAH3967621.1 hypothetical protein HBH51_138380 [Parastagonospora nodorum]
MCLTHLMRTCFWGSEITNVKCVAVVGRCKWLSKKGQEVAKTCALASSRQPSTPDIICSCCTYKQVFRAPNF